MKPATLDIVKDRDKIPEEAQERFATYLKAFLAPVYRCNDEGEEEAIVCPGCDSLIYHGNNPILNTLLGTFEWGIAHGDGYCGKCQWPIRMYHAPKLYDDHDENRYIVFPLAYRRFKDEDCQEEVDPAEYWKERQEKEL